MNSIQSQFIVWYFNEFSRDPLFVDMTKCSEASKWHREKTVAIHTNMVVAEYLSKAEGDWTRNDLLGAIACAFHDVGKPAARTEKWNEERGTYYSYGGHEIISARLWEDWVARNWNHFQELFDITPNDVYKINWMIEHHRPWGLKDVAKRTNLFTTAQLTVGIDVYFRMLRADNWGRIGDTQDLNRQGVMAWMDDFVRNNEPRFYRPHWSPELTASLPVANSLHPMAVPTLHVLIGCSGSGKSTFSKLVTGDVEIYSWDQLRLDWYDASDYSHAFEMSVEDKEFGNRVNAHLTDMIRSKVNVIVDNTNISAKRRKFAITQARSLGYRVVGVIFPSAMNVVLDRQHSRGDKNVPHNAVTSQYMHTQMPQFGEFDEIIVHGGNLT